MNKKTATSPKRKTRQVPVRDLKTRRDPRGGDSKPTETVTLGFGSIKQTYTSQQQN